MESFDHPVPYQEYKSLSGRPVRCPGSHSHARDVDLFGVPPWFTLRVFAWNGSLLPRWCRWPIDSEGGTSLHPVLPPFLLLSRIFRWPSASTGPNGCFPVLLFRKPPGLPFQRCNGNHGAADVHAQIWVLWRLDGQHGERQPGGSSTENAKLA